MLKVKLPYLDNATITNQRDCNPEYWKKCQMSNSSWKLNGSILYYVPHRELAYINCESNMFGVNWFSICGWQGICGNPNGIPCCERRAGEGDRPANIPCDWGGGM
jgi:hypothetical protein